MQNERCSNEILALRVCFQGAIIATNGLTFHRNFTQISNGRAIGNPVLIAILIKSLIFTGVGSPYYIQFRAQALSSRQVSLFDNLARRIIRCQRRNGRSSQDHHTCHNTGKHFLYAFAHVCFLLK